MQRYRVSTYRNRKFVILIDFILCHRSNRKLSISDVVNYGTIVNRTTFRFGFWARWGRNIISGTPVKKKPLILQRFLTHWFIIQNTSYGTCFAAIFSQVNATEPHWWDVNNVYGNDRPLLEWILTGVYVAVGRHWATCSKQISYYVS